MVWKLVILFSDQQFKDIAIFIQGRLISAISNAILNSGFLMFSSGKLVKNGLNVEVETWKQEARNMKLRQCEIKLPPINSKENQLINVISTNNMLKCSD